MTAKIAITMGDPAGIGPELIERLLQEQPQWREQVCVIGLRNWVSRLEQSLGVTVESTGGPAQCAPGHPDVEGARAALEAMQRAASGCREGRYRGVVTGPISKHECRKAGMTQPGQTEFFAEQWGGEPTMAFVAPTLTVSLATWHVPLMDLPNWLTPATLERCVRHTAELMLRLGVSRPRIAVCGLNPHAGEQGQIGREEVEWINPLIARLQANLARIELSGCHPADTVFYRHVSGEFDAVVALYHDQALVPVKTVAFHEAVNVTLGLPHVRTSPDHGTAFGIAGKGVARPLSLQRALELADRLTRQVV